jgi:AcrR family transcriptional regulator
MLYAYFGSKEGLYVAYIDRTGRELLDRMVGAARREDPPVLRMRARVAEFLAFVEEYRDGWTVLFTEMASSRPLAEEVAELRDQIAAWVRRTLEGGGSSSERLNAPASDGLAHAIVGAGESLANWWLEHPQVSRDEVVDWYVKLIQATVSAALPR